MRTTIRPGRVAGISSRSKVLPASLETVVPTAHRPTRRDVAAAPHHVPAPLNDPRQAEIARLLRLIGGEPAAYFADACRLMDGEATLEATTHVVGHVLRELNGALIEVV